MNPECIYKQVLTAFLFVIPGISLSQDFSVSDAILSVVESLAGDESGTEEAEIYTGRLYELLDDRVKVNSADEAELSRLFFLSGFQVKALADYVRSTGKIISYYEIANIPGFDRETAEMMIPFISMNSDEATISENIKWRSTLLNNISVKPSQNASGHIGSPWKILTKYRFAAGPLSGGISAEKDSGEKFFSGGPPAPEFLSGHLVYTGKGILKKIVAGDYSARFGLGTGINTSIRTGISLTVPVNPPGADEIKPYTSTDENNFLRGMAATLQVKNAGVSLFCSVNNIDATTGPSDGPLSGHIVSFYRSGLHNTPALLMKKDAVTVTSLGACLSGTFRNFRTGIMFSETRFSLPVENQNPRPGDLFDFEGDINRLVTAYYNTLVKRMILFGEFSYDLTNKTAFVQGLTSRPADRLNISLWYRNYEPGFTSFHGKGPFSNSSGDNISGVVGNFTLEAARYLFISAGCDLRYNRWLKYRCDAPSVSVSKEVKIKYLPSERLTVECLYSFRRSALNSGQLTGIVRQEDIVSRSGRATIRFSPSSGLTFGNRIEYKRIFPSGSRGMLLFQDITCRFEPIPLTVWVRYCIFNSSDWDSRLYTYENDLLYSFSIPALSGEGTRGYIMLKWKIRENTEIRLKYGVTSITGPDEGTRCYDEIKIQFRMKL